MAEKIYAAVGSLAMKKGKEKGLHIFQYEPRQGTFTPVGSWRPDVNVGQSLWNHEKGMFYFVHESRDKDGRLGGGGRLLWFAPEPETGIPGHIEERDTFSSQPCDICLDRQGNYLLVVHHGSDSVVTKMVRNTDGSFEARTDSDDCAVLLFQLDESGRPQEIRDAVLHGPLRENGKIKKISHLHCIEQSLDGKLFLACDKGLDVIHKYRLDREAGKLIFMGDTFVEEGVHPRYGKFHPSLPVFYQNCENSAFLHVWTYESGSGTLERIQKTPLLFSEKEARAWTEEGASDLLITRDGRYLYAALRGINVLAVYLVQEDGRLKLIQNTGCGGKNPRGLCLSPDERFLFVMNRDSDAVARFNREPDGRLNLSGEAIQCRLPGNMTFLGV